MIPVFGDNVALGQLVLRKLDQLPYFLVAFLASWALFGHLRHGDWFSRRRIIASGGLLLAAQTLVFGFLIAVSYGLIAKQANPLSTDFVSFYAAGRLAASGWPELAYDQSAHYEAEQDATEVGITYRYFFIRPSFCCCARRCRACPT